MLLGLFIIVPLLKRFLVRESNIICLFFGIAILANYFDFDSGYWNIYYKIAYYGIFFLLGMWLCAYDQQDRLKSRWGIVVSLVTLGVYWWAYSKGIRMESLVVQIMVALAPTYLLYYCIRSMKAECLKRLPLMGRFGRESLPLYILHVYFLALFRTLLPKMGIYDFTINMLLMMVVGLAGPLLMYYVMKKYRYTRFVFHPLQVLKGK